MGSRRRFLQHAGWLGWAAATGSPGVWTPLEAAAVHPRQPILVFLFLPGAVDGLALAAPLGDPHYAALRPRIGLKLSDRPLALERDIYLHPALAPLHRLWESKELAVVLNSGSAHPTRSHFEAQDIIQYGLGGANPKLPLGFLNRALAASRGKIRPLQAAAFQANLPLSLSGNFPALNINSLAQFGLRGGAKGQKDIYQIMYEGTHDRLLQETSRDAFQAQQTVARIKLLPPSKVAYPKSPYSAHMKDLAAVIRADVGLEIAALEWSGWDTHVQQGGAKGALAQNFARLAESLAAFQQDLGEHWQRTCIVALTEFGRTVKENGSGGTDHGHGSTTLVLGGAVQGQRLLGSFPGLHPDALYEQRDLPVTTDYRDILAEVFRHHLGYSELSSIFPQYVSPAPQSLGLIRGHGVAQLAPDPASSR